MHMMKTFDVMKDKAYIWNITCNLRYYNHTHDENIWCYEGQTLRIL
jgi:hypothetical protein